MNAFHIGNQCRFSHLKLDMRSNLGMKLITWVKAIKINCSLSINQSNFFRLLRKGITHLTQTQAQQVLQKR